MARKCSRVNFSAPAGASGLRDCAAHWQNHLLRDRTGTWKRRSWLRERSAALAAEPLAKAAHVEIHDRGSVESEKLRQEQPPDDGDAHGPAQFRSEENTS